MIKFWWWPLSRLLVGLALVVTAVAARGVDGTEPLTASNNTLTYESGKVLRKKLADLPRRDREDYESILAEFEHASKQVPSPAICKDVTAFCKNNEDEDFVPSLMAREKMAASWVLGDKGVALKVSPISTIASQFERLAFVGWIADGMGKAAPWSAVSRIFKDANGNLVQISEWDFVSDGGGLLLIDEFQRVKVGPFHASMLKNGSPSGKTVWQISWVEMRKKIAVSYVCPTDLKCAREETVLALVNSLYKRP